MRIKVKGKELSLMVLYLPAMMRSAAGFEAAEALHGWARDRLGCLTRRTMPTVLLEANVHVGTPRLQTPLG